MNVSLKNLKEKEQNLIVNTPKSLEACYAEGIRPEELLYAPIEEFARNGLTKEIQQMNYEFYESQREKLLKIVRKRYELISNPTKRCRSQESLHISELILSGTQKIREKNLKQISKFVNYKLGNIRPVINDKSNDTNNVTLPKGKEAHLNTARESQTSRAPRKKEVFLASAKSFNINRDADLIASEKREYEKKMFHEKQKNIEIDERRKKTSEKIQEHIMRAKMIKAKDNEIKLEIIAKKESAVQKKIQENQRNREEKRSKNNAKSQEKFFRVVSRKLEFDEYIGGIRDKIVREENEKIKNHDQKKQKLQEEQLGKICNKNQEWNVKSKIFREKIDKKIEEKKEKIRRELQIKEKKLQDRKNEAYRNIDFTKERNKLKEIEKQWNIERENRKEEFVKNELMNDIKNNGRRALELQSAKEYMQKLRYNLTVKVETQKARINEAIYMMAVQKKYNLDQLSEICEQ